MSGVQALTAIDHRPTAEVIADRLREGVVNGNFAAGEQIHESQLAHTLNVSRGPVREALHRLVQEGLFDGRPNRGVFVKEVTDRDVAEVTEARRVIECAAADVINRQRGEDLACLADELLEATRPMSAAVAIGDRAALRRADIRFHQLLVRGSRNSRLERAYTTLATEALICMLHLGEGECGDRLVASHVEIANLLRCGDVNAVHEALRDHLTTRTPVSSATDRAAIKSE